MKTIQYVINVQGNASSIIQGITKNVSSMNANVSHSIGMLESFGTKIVVFQQATQMLQGLNSALDSITQPGIQLNSSLADLSAITGQVGSGLADIESRARKLAKTYGNSAAESVESFKLILSQLSPEIASNSEALQKMGESVAVLSKSMGGDSVAATQVLTTAMNQFQVSLDDPMRAAAEMARMMNVMAAAAKEGSAELPQIQQALQNAGMAAKAAGVSFEETNAAIQVLDKAGKKGAEGGVALRNVLATLAQGRFLPQDVQQELAAAGVDIERLSDKTLSLSDRMQPLKVVLNDAALLTKMFGKENNNAAMALIAGLEQMNLYAEAITGTNSAYDQSKTVMESYAERQKRITQYLEDFKISLFNVTGGLSLWVGGLAKIAIPLAQLVPLFTLVSSACKFLNVHIIRTYTSLGMYNGYLKLGRVANLGFIKNLVQTTVAFVRLSTVGVFSAIKAIGAYVLSLITGGAASVGFAATASTAFAAFKLSAITACRAVSVAITSIPLLGWIAGAMAGLIALGAYLYKTSESFRATLLGVWDAVKSVFTGIGGFIGEVLEGIWHLIKGVFNPANWFDDSFHFKDGLSKISNAAERYGQSIGDAFRKGRDESLSKKEAKKTASGDGAPLDEPTDITPPTGSVNPIQQGLGTIGMPQQESKIKNIKIQIGNLIDKLEIHTENLREDSSRIRDLITETVLASINNLNTI